MKNIKSFAVPAVLLSAMNIAAGPVTTVPWNGYPGAVSYTYDDARPTQATVLIPQLDAAGVKATFFISLNNCGGSFEKDKETFKTAARNGHELANHTRDHNAPSSTTIVSDMANYLRALDPSVEALTFAYPGCTPSGQTNVESQNFIARNCGSTTYSWNNQPQKWMEMQGFILTSQTAQSQDNSGTAVGLINGVKNSNSWVTMIVHGITSGDQYSVTKETNQKLLDAGKSSGLWIETYQKVAAYYRAHFTMDNVTAQSSGNGWKMTWTSPHPKMPKSVMLRVKLADATFGTGYTVLQGGVAIPKQSDGSYIIDFMKLSLDVQKGGVSSSAIPSSSSVIPVSSSVVTSSSSFVWQWPSSSSDIGVRVMDTKGILPTIAEYQVYDLFGKLQAQGSKIPQNLSAGRWIVKALDGRGQLIQSWVIDRE